MHSLRKIRGVALKAPTNHVSQRTSDFDNSRAKRSDTEKQLFTVARDIWRGSCFCIFSLNT